MGFRYIVIVTTYFVAVSTSLYISGEQHMDNWNTQYINSHYFTSEESRSYKSGSNVRQPSYQVYKPGYSIYENGFQSPSENTFSPLLAMSKSGRARQVQPEINKIDVLDHRRSATKYINNSNISNGNYAPNFKHREKSMTGPMLNQTHGKIDSSALPYFRMNVGTPGILYSGGVLGYFLRLAEDVNKKGLGFNPNERVDLLFSALGKHANDKTKLEPLRELLSDSRLDDYLGPDFDPNNYSTNGQLLRGILQSSLKSPAVNRDSRWMNAITYFLDKVQTIDDGEQILDPAFFYQLVDESSLETIAEDTEIFYPQIELLLSALGPYANDKNQIKLLVDFLHIPNLKEILGPRFQPVAYKTNGELLQHLFIEALYSEAVRANEDLLQTIQFYINKISRGKESERPIDSEFFNRLGLPESKQIMEDLIAPVDILLLALGPHTQDQDKIKVLRTFLTHPNLQTILGNKFTHTEFSTNGELLQAILLEALYSDVVKENNELYESLIYFMNKVRAGGDSSSISIGSDFFTRLPQSKGSQLESDPNIDYILLALSPYVIKMKEIIPLKEFLNNPKKLFSALGPDFDFTSYFTIGQLLQGILMKALNSEDVKNDQVLYDSIKYFVGKVRTTGNAAKSTDTGPYDTREGILDLNGAFGALNLEKIDKDNNIKYLTNLYRFFFSEFNPRKHLKYFPFHDFKTRGQFLRGLFRHLIASKSVSVDVKRDLDIIKRYIKATGPGSVPFELFPVK